jgi:hypothetical protein
MIRHALRLLALGAAASVAAGGEATAGSCCNCPAPCPTEQVVEIFEAHAPAPFYVVDQGPNFTGPGIISFPTVRKEYQSITDYPFIGHGYGRHRHPHGEVVLWHKSRVVYVDAKAPRRLVGRSTPTPLVRPPLNPRDK